MGIYIHKTADDMLADGATEQVHPHYEEFLVVVFDPMPPQTYMVTAFCYSRQEFWRFLNNPAPSKKRWFVYPNIVNLIRPDTIRLHKLDVAGPESFEDIDRREELEAIHKDWAREQGGNGDITPQTGFNDPPPLE